MNVLYKYCDQVGIGKILRTLEIKLPYISQVNDPHECWPVMYCPDDKSAIETLCLSALKRNNISPPIDYKQKLENGEIPKKLEEGLRQLLKEWNEQHGCLLSVSKAAQNTVMWAHYTEQHKGAVIGIDFDTISPATNRPPGILMKSVSYSKDRPKINILEDSDPNLSPEVYEKAAMTKSVDWSYEEEFRTIFFVNELEKMKRQGLSNFRKLNPKDTKESWFLKLNPISIKEVIFGLYTDDSLKSDIRRLIERQDLQHVKLKQVEESETYTFNLKEDNIC